MCCRRSPPLLQFISDESDKIRAAKEGQEGRRKGGGRKGNKDVPIDVDDAD